MRNQMPAKITDCTVDLCICALVYGRAWLFSAGCTIYLVVSAGAGVYIEIVAMFSSLEIDPFVSVECGSFIQLADGGG